MRMLDPNLLPQLSALLLLLLASLSLLIVHRVGRLPAWLPRGSQIPLCLLFAGAAIRFLVLATQYHRPIPVPPWLTPGIFLAAAGCFVLLLIRHLSPAARRGRASVSAPDLRHVFAETDDIIVIADWSRRITEINHPERLWQAVGQSCETLSELARALQAHAGSTTSGTVSFDSGDSWTGEIALGEDVFLVGSAPVTDREPNARVGTLVLFHDIREERLRALRLAEKNRELTAANRQLAQQVQVETKLARAEETASLLETVQRDLADRLSRTLALIREARALPDGGSASPDLLARIVHSLREAYQSVRKTVQALNDRKDA